MCLQPISELPPKDTILSEHIFFTPAHISLYSNQTDTFKCREDLFHLTCADSSLLKPHRFSAGCCYTAEAPVSN